MKYILIGAMLGLLFGVFGFPIHNYYVDKCEIVSENQYYEAVANCYMVLEKPELDLFWSIFLMSLIGLISFGFIGLIFEFELSKNEMQ